MDIRQFAYAGIDVYGILADYLGKTTQEIKDMDISFDDLSKALQKASKEGGKYFGAIGSFSETLTGQINTLKTEAQEGLMDLTKSLLPIAKKVVARIREIIKGFNSLSDAQKETILKIGLFSAAVGPVLKLGSSLIGVISNVAKGMGTLTKAIGLAKNGIGDATRSSGKFGKSISSNGQPNSIGNHSHCDSDRYIISFFEQSNKSVKRSFYKYG